jgi:nicotinamide-nucleotide amidase
MAVFHHNFQFTPADKRVFLGNKSGFCGYAGPRNGRFISLILLFIGSEMKKASIISIGNELLSGDSLDTNSRWLSQQLLLKGIPTVSISTVGDDIAMISDAIGQAAGYCDMILISGGLGPTEDDLTRYAVADFLGVELGLRDKVLRQMGAFFKSRGITMSKTNKIQAYFPEGAKVLENPNGTAPGMMSKYEDKLIVAMPGVPSEMKPMFSDHVAPEIEKYGHGQVVLTGKIKCFGTGESVVAEKLGDIMDRGRNPIVNCTVSGGIITLHVVAISETEAQGQEMIDVQTREICEILGDIVYSTEDKSLAEIVAEGLKTWKKTICVAESCTGGLLAKVLTDMGGATEYFTQGWVTYCNEAKISQLGVERKTIEEYGAVSEQVALEMVRGAREKADTDVAIAITGIAGPGGRTEQKPVGLVYIAVETRSARNVHRFVFSYSREYVRQRAVFTALNLLRLEL